jgi:hypothetical protein
MSSTTVRDFVLKIPKNRNNDHDDVKQPVYFNLKITQPTHRVVKNKDDLEYMEDYLEKKERKSCEGMSLEFRRMAAKMNILVRN